MDNFPPLLHSNVYGDIQDQWKWEQYRRPEIIRLLEENVYGITPAFDFCHFTPLYEKAEPVWGKAKLRAIRAEYGKDGRTGRFDFYLLAPLSGRNHPVIIFGHYMSQDLSNLNRGVTHPLWPAERMIDRGFAAIFFHFEEIDPDEDDGFVNGVHKVAGLQRNETSWGTIAAWAWGFSRIMDYVETDKDLNPERVAVAGHSRGGKTALWAGAVDQRFYMVASNNSGSTGAALSRTKKGERVADINRLFPYWFCGRYKEYNGREDAMPFDQHMLLSLIAPRKLYVASASDDEWADPYAEFNCCIAASPAYRIYKKGGMFVEKMPPVNHLEWGDGIGYHLRKGAHDLTPYDWDRFMDFFYEHNASSTSHIFLTKNMP